MVVLTLRFNLVLDPLAVPGLTFVRLVQSLMVSNRGALTPQPPRTDIGGTGGGEESARRADDGSRCKQPAEKEDGSAVAKTTRR